MKELFHDFIKIVKYITIYIKIYYKYYKITVDDKNIN